MAYPGQPAWPQQHMPSQETPYEQPEQSIEPMPTVPATKKMTVGGWIAVVGGIITLVSVFMPWYMIPGSTLYPLGYTFSGIQTGIFGILPLVFVILVLIMALLKKPLVAGILGIVTLVLVLLPNLILSAMFASYGLSGAIWAVTAWGWYLAMVGSIMGTVGGFVGWKQQH